MLTFLGKSHTFSPKDDWMTNSIVGAGAEKKIMLTRQILYCAVIQSQVKVSIKININT